jgi:hypothetical protein
MHSRSPATAQGLSSADLLRAGTVLGLTLLTVLVCWLIPPAKAGGEAGVVMDLPRQIGMLQAFPAEVSSAEKAILPPDTTFARYNYGYRFSNPTERIFCSIVLSGAEKRSIHRPERCLPGQGFRIDSSHTETVKLASGRDLDVTALLLERPVTLANGQPFVLRSYFLYWFVGKDTTTSSQLVRILETNWDMLVHRLNQRWAYVTVSTNISRDFDPAGHDEQQTLDTLKQFIHDSAPYYMISEMPSGEKAAAQ